MKEMNWMYMVVCRYYQNGMYEAQIVERENFRQENFLNIQNDCKQEFYPCTNVEKAIRILCRGVAERRTMKRMQHNKVRHKDQLLHKDKVPHK